MGFNCGIVGLPNVGKSTLFNALTRAGIAAANYPFCTIDPNVGIVAVPDPRLDKIAAIVHPRQIIPTTVEFVDIAGLVAGASQGEGLGNQFLAHIRETDAIAQVVRCFEDQNVIHVAGRVDPRADIDTIQTELALADLETVERAIQRLAKTVRAAGDKDARARLEILEQIRAGLNFGQPVRALQLSSDARAAFRELHLLTAKPMLYIANINENSKPDNPLLNIVNEIAQKEGATVIPVCAAIEAEIVELPETERAEFIQELGLDEPGLNKVIRHGYQLLGLQTFFTAGPKEVRAWTVRIGATAPEAAGVIHTDFAKGFIRAEVISYNDFITYNGEHGAKEAGKWRLEGKDYLVKDGDLMHFRFNV